MRRARPPRDPQIRTKRLTLRSVTAADVDDLVAGLNDYDVAKMTARVPFPYRRSDALAFVAASGRRRAAGSAFDFAVTRNGRLIGVCGLFGLPYRAELGYWFARACWGEGCATEAAGAVCAFGFGVLRLGLIRAGVFTDNPRSWRVQAKLGFRRVNARSARSLARNAEVAHIDAVLTPAHFIARRRT